MHRKICKLIKLWQQLQCFSHLPTCFICQKIQKVHNSQKFLKSRLTEHAPKHSRAALRAVLTLAFSDLQICQLHFFKGFRQSMIDSYQLFHCFPGWKNIVAMPRSCHDHTMIMAKHGHDHAMMTAWRRCFLAWSS